jgi:chaperonin cofactor prefoldin
MENLLNEIKKIDNKIVKLEAQKNNIQQEIFKNMKKIEEIKETDLIGDTTMYCEILAKLFKQKYNYDVKIVKLTKDKTNLTNHLITIEFN